MLSPQKINRSIPVVFPAPPRVSSNSRNNSAAYSSTTVSQCHHTLLVSDSFSVTPQTITHQPSATPLGNPATPLDDIDTIVATYQQRIFRFHLISIRDRDVAQTLTQDTFVRAWSARGSFRGDCSVLTWLMRIALNLVRDHTRTDRFRFWKKVSETAIDVSDISSHVPHRDSSLESRLIASEQMALVWESVAKLSDRQRSIFLLRFLEELELSEIADITGPAHQHRQDSSLPSTRNHPAHHNAILKDSL